MGPRGKVPTVQRNGRSKLPLGFKKRRKTARKSITNKSSFLSPKKHAASALFDWGVRFGIKCMMVGRDEVSELTKTMNKTAKIIEELKSEIIIKKSSHAHQFLDYVGNSNGLEFSNTSGKDEETMFKKTKSELGETDSKFWCLSLIDNGECGSSALTEDSDSLALVMDQLEEELEFELQKLPGDSVDTNFLEETRSKFYEVQVPNEGYYGADDLNFKSSPFHAVSATELNQKLCQLKIEQQENQIAELESELYLARSKLQEKEAELQALKNCVTLLTELPLPTVSGTSHGTEIHKGTTNWDYNTLDSKSEQSVGDMKTLAVYEPSSYYRRSDSDLYEHTKYIDKII
ncbi:uncharacterized protein LOC114181440 isoform X2 [Vigna unguiculata]|nr:uncharacterized protein LOC114181440 isoform X2 [Vigna unguiculata]